MTVCSAGREARAPDGCMVDATKKATDQGHVNQLATQRYFSSSHNRRLWSMFRDGGRYRDSLPLHTSISPNNSNLYKTKGGIDAVTNAAHEMAGRGWWMTGSSGMVPC